MNIVVLALAAATLLLSAGQSSASLQFGIAATNPQHPNACWFEDKKLAIKVGEEMVPPGTCGKIRCSLNADGVLQYTLEQCGAFAPPPGCRVEQDPALGYPACCSNLVCDVTA